MGVPFGIMFLLPILMAVHTAQDDTSLVARMQLKTLLFGMGETFRVLLQRSARNSGGG